VIESLICEEAGFGESDGEGQVCFDGVRRGDSGVGMESRGQVQSDGMNASRLAQLVYVA
jgi:hypothetical protein